jgi:3-oxoacyl-[acyl-carrier protein] reductase
MIRTRWGRIINVTSISGVLGNRGQTNYAAAKAGLHGATKSLALELASRGISVNAIAPGIITGKLTENNFDPARIKTMVPMQRAGTPDEVAALANFLASDEAGYISGQVISINGAMG